MGAVDLFRAQREVWIDPKHKILALTLIFPSSLIRGLEYQAKYFEEKSYKSVFDRTYRYYKLGSLHPYKLARCFGEHAIVFVSRIG